MRILLTGAGGQLGQALQRVLAAEAVAALTHAELDITDSQAVGRAVEIHRPEWIVNVAAYNLVDEAEGQADAAFQVNALGVLHLAQAARAAGSTLVHFSTDYVFDGFKNTPYTETDLPNPLSVYGLSKLSGEILLRGGTPKYFLIRSCGLYGWPTNPRRDNFVERLLAAARAGQPLRVVSDQVLTPTSASELAEKVVPLVRTGRYGLYHMTNEGQCSWYEFAQEIFRLAGFSPTLEAVTLADYGARAQRPRYSVLENRAYAELGLPSFRPWQEALADTMRQRG
ncbi:MAG: dTDP-4-dehydrorhamnose reductase [Candidatus Acidiferrales bacterium]